MKVKDIDKELKSLQKRLERYGKYEGMYLNQKYYNLIDEAENIKQRIRDKDEDLTPQRVQGLIRRIKGIQKRKVTEYFSIYDPETDETYSIIEAPIATFKIEKIPQIIKEKATEIIEKVKSRYRKTPTEYYVPQPEPPESERTYSTEVLDNVLRRLYRYQWGLWTEIASMIHESIALYGEEAIAKLFEENAQEYNTTGEMKYDEARGLYDEMPLWEFTDIDTNKRITSELDYYEAEEI